MTHRSTACSCSRMPLSMFWGRLNLRHNLKHTWTDNRQAPTHCCLPPGNSCLFSCFFPVLRQNINAAVFGGTPLQTPAPESQRKDQSSRSPELQTGKIAQLVKSLSGKHEDLRSAPASTLKRAKGGGLCLESQQWGGGEGQVDSYGGSLTT